MAVAVRADLCHPGRWSECRAPTTSITASPGRRWRGTPLPAGSARWATPPRRRWAPGPAPGGSPGLGREGDGDGGAGLALLPRGCRLPG